MRPERHLLPVEKGLHLSSLLQTLTPIWVALMLVGCKMEDIRPADTAGAVTEFQIIASYEGRVSLDSSGQSSGPTEIIIRSQADYEAFLIRIPRNKITKVNPAPPSDDPLLGKPFIDFESHMMLVALRAGTMYVAPRFLSISTDKNGLIVHIQDPDLGETIFANQQEGIGSYRAVVVAKDRGPIRFFRQTPPGLPDWVHQLLVKRSRKHHISSLG